MSVLVLEPLEADVLEWLAERHQVLAMPELAADLSALKEQVSQAQAILLPASIALDAEMIRSAPRLRAVGRISAGAENIDMETCRFANIEVVRAPTATASAEAEFVVGALLALLRRVAVETADGALVGRELGCATVGLVGLSPAARQLATLLPVFGARVIGYDPGLHHADPLWAQWGIEPYGLRELMQAADAVSVQLAYFPRYRGLMGERVLGYCKPSQVLVSTSHSALFDEQALADALHGGRLLAAWMDLMEPGLMEPGRPLHGAPGLQVTPRLAATTRESRMRAAWSVVRRISEILSTPEPQAEFRPTVPGVLAVHSSEPKWR
ncbi:NAD(P)-dependent oxidoreductase [Roseateles amylovorans]|jgi:D-3-phosphoglycerate dehydrogenase / 2-oxoglutarate reductase|uniref:Phosphoglycerate dehydrogenase n=1 Tax=Roseateles amylovorans TaxID=2978473 RepID=A0ABY6ASQ8_9BURK|nr:NAD(P)-dependent oxidoreductase [Roseateles amylovorans]UXH76274.1 phosphoglycerate dehydrogenase [Roseateles amylovorans]